MSTTARNSSTPNVSRHLIEPRASLYRMATRDHICPFGLKAKALLRRKGFDVDDHLLRTRDETDSFKAQQHVDSTPQVFLDGTRIGGYDNLREHFGMHVRSKDQTTYRPVIATFGVSLLVALAARVGAGEELVSTRALLWFAAVSMCLLALLKLRDLESFTNQFLGYDLLAQRVVPYAYAYPWVELVAGLGMLASVATPLMAAGALLIGSVGAASVIKAVYIDKRALTCACVGGDSKVPLGFVSLAENLMMVSMGIAMLVLS